MPRMMSSTRSLSVTPKRGAAIVAEIELGKVAVQVRFAAMLIDADHAALEDREHVLDRVGVNHDVAFAAGIFASRMLHGAMARHIRSPVIGVEARLVGVEDGLAVGVADQHVAHSVPWSHRSGGTCGPCRRARPDRRRCASAHRRPCPSW